MRNYPPKLANFRIRPVVYPLQGITVVQARPVMLAVLGIYSIIAFSVASRAQEMAIRMALGSQRSHILRLIPMSGLKLAAIGCVFGLAGAAAGSNVLRSFLFHVSPFDPVVMILTAIAVFGLALAASIFPRAVPRP